MHTKMNRPKVRKRCAKGHVMDLIWRTCPKCTGRPALLASTRSAVDWTMNDRSGPRGTDRTIVVDPAEVASRYPLARLVAMTGSVNPSEVFLTPGRTKIGKAPTESPNSNLCAITGDGHMSRNHAIIEIEGDRVTITDSKSLNGTLVNGTLVERASLRDGDTIQMGQAIFRFECAS